MMKTEDIKKTFYKKWIDRMQYTVPWSTQLEICKEITEMSGSSLVDWFYKDMVTLAYFWNHRNVKFWTKCVQSPTDPTNINRLVFKWAFS
jgi:hypothetical protein